MDINHLYNTYTKYVDTIVASGDISNFKNNSNYTYMLEHASESHGKQYLELIKSMFQLSDIDIILYTHMNDSVGNPVKYKYLGTEISPSSLRYIFQAMLILKHFESTGVKTFRIVEVGGGYGGLCLAINYCLRFYPSVSISEYNIVDLEAPTKLQTKYLSQFDLSFPFKTHNAVQFGADIEPGNLFLISNYCFSEIDARLQEQYVTNLFPKIAHGFITWNTIPVYEFGKTITVEDEYPKTGSQNKYVRF